jgi:hypothetical protein
MTKCKTRTEWLDLLHKCQNGDATCMFVLGEIERENARLLGLLSEVFQCIEYAERCGGLDSVTEIKVRRALSASPNVH